MYCFYFFIKLIIVSYKNLRVKRIVKYNFNFQNFWVLVVLQSILLEICSKYVEK